MLDLKEINFTGKLKSPYLNGKRIIKIFPYDSNDFWEYMKGRIYENDIWFFAELSIDDKTIDVIVIQEK